MLSPQLSPQLSSPKLFQEWAIQQKNTDINSAIKLLLDQNDELATFRAACLGHWFMRPNLYRNLLVDSAEANDMCTRIYAKSYLALLDFVEARQTTSQTLNYWVPLLEGDLILLENAPKTDFAKETKAALFTNLGLIKSVVGDYVGGKLLAAQAIFLSRQIWAKVSEMRANNLLIQTNILTGDVSSALNDIYDNLKNADQLDHHVATYQQISVAGCLTHLGDLGGALQWLDHARLEPTNVTAINSVRQWFASLSGHDDLENPIETGYAPTINEAWIVEGLRRLLSVKALPRTNKNLIERSAQLNSAVQLCRSIGVFPGHWYYLLNRWVAATALKWQGKSILSLHSLTGIKEPAEEWLELRVLLNGLRLEQALDLNLPSLAIEPIEQALLQVFESARTVPMASPEGLADLLIFWHPLAAAYMAVAFPNLPNLSPALENIMRLGGKNSIFGRAASPALASELVLRALNLDLVEGKPLAHVKLGAGERGGFRENLLATARGNNTYYEMPIAAIQIAYGLKKHAGNEIYSGVAWGVLNQYGLCPMGSGNELQEPMVALESLVARLIENRISLQDFCKECFRIV
jgi:hypothetical protein